VAVLEALHLFGVEGSILQEEEMEALFGGMNKTFPALQWLQLSFMISTQRVALLHSPSAFSSFPT